MEILWVRAGMQQANCRKELRDWLKRMLRPARLDMGIYWRQPHQSAPHLINEPHWTDQEVYASIQRLAVSWSQLQQVSPPAKLRFLRLCFFLTDDTGFIYFDTETAAFFIYNHKDLKWCKFYFPCYLIWLDQYG